MCLYKHTNGMCVCASVCLCNSVRGQCHRCDESVRVGVEYSWSMLEPVRPGAVSPNRTLYLRTFSHFVVVNKTSLSLSLSLSLSRAAASLILPVCIRANVGQIVRPSFMRWPQPWATMRDLTLSSAA